MLGPAVLVALRRLHIARCWDRVGDVTGTSERPSKEEVKRKADEQEQHEFISERSLALHVHLSERRRMDGRERKRRNVARHVARHRKPRVLTMSQFVRQLPALERLSYAGVGAPVAARVKRNADAKEENASMLQEWLRDDILATLQHAPHLTRLCLRGLSILSPESRQVIRHAVLQRTTVNPTHATLHLEE